MAKILSEDIEQKPLKEFTEQAYLNYSMAVILDRALPHIGDGLKPVQRRIIYAMSELGLKATAKFKKSARTVGDVLGKFHPHSDAACYEAMVLMAQSFSYRYTIIDGQGNWGSLDDPKSFAAMRYTESRLSRYAETLLSEIELGTVDWQPNFDGTLEEPVILPAKLPNILLNGTTGIAVGMATDIPPHNLKEIAEACIHLLKNPKATLRDILQFVQGPDYPTSAEIITPKSELHKMYETGNGTVRLRAHYHVEDEDIIIDALPHQVSSSKILEQIAAQMNNKKLSQVVNLRDESDQDNPVRLVIVMRSNRVDSEALMSHLFATTELERSYRINMNVIGLNGRPQVKNLLTLLQEWLVFRTNTTKRRLDFRLQKIIARLHILEGLNVVYLNLDKVIAIIRKEDDPKPVLMAKFKLTETQVDAILETKLRHLAKLEEMKIRAEMKELQDEQEEIESTLSSNTKLRNLLVRELEECVKNYADKRHSPIVKRDSSQAFSEVEQVAKDPITVILSQKGWVRSAKGHEIDAAKLSYRSGDEFLCSALGKNHENAVFLDSNGRSYSLPAYSLPSARGLGEPLTGRITPESGAEFVSVLMAADEQKFLLASSSGYGFVTNFANMLCKNKKGKSLIKLSEGAKPLPPIDLGEDKLHIALFNSAGYLLIVDRREIPELDKGKGIKLAQISSKAGKSEHLVAIACLTATSQIIVVSGKKKLTLSVRDWKAYKGERAKRGTMLPKGFQKVDAVEIV